MVTFHEGVLELSIQFPTRFGSCSEQDYANGSAEISFHLLGEVSRVLRDGDPVLWESQEVQVHRSREHRTRSACHVLFLGFRAGVSAAEIVDVAKRLCAALERMTKHAYACFKGRLQDVSQASGVEQRLLSVDSDVTGRISGVSSDGGLSIQARFETTMGQFLHCMQVLVDL